MTDYPNIQTPTLLLDEQKARNNIERMAKKAASSRVRFRPHFKTHQSAHIGQWFRDYGVSAITVSSLKMADYFARHGWTDILVAFPINIREIDLVNQLANAIELHLIVESVEAATLLSDQLTSSVGLWIEVDTGYGRTGVRWNDSESLLKLAGIVSQAPKLKFHGLLAHAGHSYKAAGKDAVIAVHNQSNQRLCETHKKLQTAGFSGLEMSIGDTPSCSMVTFFEGVQEIRPGNCAFYDWTQHTIGSCGANDIAVAMACPVVAVYPDRQEIVVYGGGVHFSKECLWQKETVTFGKIVEWNGHRWGSPLAGANLSNLSQEHGTITFENADLARRYAIGDVVFVLPVHSCLTANLMGRYRTLDGQWIEMMAR